MENSNGFCLWGGICNYDIDKRSEICECKIEFSGSQCEC